MRVTVDAVAATRCPTWARSGPVRRGCGVVTGFEKYPTGILLGLRENLLQGLERVAHTIENGTFHTIGEKGSSPAQAGCLTLALLNRVQETLDTRSDLV